MNNDFEGWSDGYGPIMLLFYAGAAAVAGLGVYGLRKAGVTGRQAWLGVLAAPVVYVGWRAVADSRRAEREARQSAARLAAQASAPTPSLQPVAPRTAPLNDFQLLDQLALMGLQ